MTQSDSIQSKPQTVIKSLLVYFIKMEFRYLYSISMGKAAISINTISSIQRWKTNLSLQNTNFTSWSHYSGLLYTYMQSKCYKSNFQSPKISHSDQDAKTAAAEAALIQLGFATDPTAQLTVSMIIILYDLYYIVARTIANVAHTTNKSGCWWCCSFQSRRSSTTYATTANDSICSNSRYLQNNACRYIIYFQGQGMMAMPVTLDPNTMQPMLHQLVYQ